MISARVHRVALPLIRPLTSAAGSMSERVVLVVEVRDGEMSGWSECGPVPGYSTETLDQVAAALEVAAASPEAASPVGMAGAAWADALLDLRLRQAGVSLAEHLGGRRTRVPAAAAIGLTSDPAEAASRAEALLEAGFRRLRLKVAPGADREPARAVLAAAGGIPVQVDANQAYAADPDAVRDLDDLGLAAIEQPLAAGDLAGHADLARRLDTPIALDESITSPGRLTEALDRGAAAMFCLKPSRLGGIEAAARAAARCYDAGVDAFPGGMWETSLGRSALAALATVPGFTVAGDVGSPRLYLARDLAPYPDLDGDGCIEVWDGPGSGPEPAPQR